MIVFCLFGWADIVREDKYETVTQWDCAKIGRFLRGEWPKPLGERIDFEQEKIPSWVDTFDGGVYSPGRYSTGTKLGTARDDSDEEEEVE